MHIPLPRDCPRRFLPAVKARAALSLLPLGREPPEGRPTSCSPQVPWYVTGHRAETVGNSSTPLTWHKRPRGSEQPRWGRFCLSPAPPRRRLALEHLAVAHVWKRLRDGTAEGARGERGGTQGSLGGCGCGGPLTVWGLSTLALSCAFTPDPKAAWAPAGSPFQTQGWGS